MSKSSDGWTIDFWMAPKDRAFYMTQNKYPEQEANLLSFHADGKPVLNVVQQQYKRECWQCGDAVVGGEVRIDVLPMLKNTAPEETSDESDQRAVRRGLRRGLVVSKQEDQGSTAGGSSDTRTLMGKLSPYCQGDSCPAQRELIPNGWFKGVMHTVKQSAQEKGKSLEEGVSSQGNIIIGELMSCPQGQSGSNGIRCTGITFETTKLVNFTKYQMESQHDLRAGPGHYTISAWAFVDMKYDGVKQLLHTTFCAKADCDVVLGGFPQTRGRWEKVSLTYSTRKNIDKYIMKLGYPLRNTEGAVKMTGVSIIYDVPVTANFMTHRLPLREWQHVLISSQVLDATANKRALKVYINGKPVRDPRTGADRVVYKGGLSPAKVGGKLGTASRIGGRWPLAPFQGAMDNVRLWDKGFTTLKQVHHAWMGDNSIEGMKPVVNYDFQDMSVATSNFDADKDEHACAMEKNMDYYGHDINEAIANVTGPKQCCDYCSASMECAVWTYNKMQKKCYLKAIGAYKNRRESATCISGTHRSSGKALSMPCNEIWDCFDCQRASDSRDQFKGQECVPVLEHDKACEPRAKVGCNTHTHTHLTSLTHKPHHPQGRRSEAGDRLQMPQFQTGFGQAYAEASGHLEDHFAQWQGRVQHSQPSVQQLRQH